MGLLNPENIETLIQSGGYVALFSLLLGCGLGLPLPEDVPLITAGILISQGHMTWYLAAPITWCGIIGGDMCLYRISRKYGYNITRVPWIGKHVTVERLQVASHWFDRYGVWVVALGRMIAGVRGAMVMAAGVTKYNLTRFVIADGLAAILSGGVFMVIGWWFGSNLPALRAHIHEWKVTLSIISVAGLLLLAVYLLWRRRGHRPILEAITDKVIDGRPISAIDAPTEDAYARKRDAEVIPPERL
jgi:membrane protein DedA with SNARE-associated domain